MEEFQGSEEGGVGLAAGVGVEAHTPWFPSVVIGDVVDGIEMGTRNGSIPLRRRYRMK